MRAMVDIFPPVFLIFGGGVDFYLIELFFSMLGAGLFGHRLKHSSGPL